MSESAETGRPIGLFDGVLARGAAAGIVADDAWLAAMLRVEAALAQAEAAAGVISYDDARRIEAACRPERFDLRDLAEAAAASGNPVVPLVARLRELVAADARDAAVDPDAGRGPAAAVHFGATSQDIIDTAAMLLAARAIDAIVGDVDAASDAAASLVEAHRDTLIAGRTLLQHALPTTFGAKAAVWLAGLDAARVRLRSVRRERLAVQLGGAVGTLAALGTDELRTVVVRALAAELGLAEPIAPWHTERTRIAELAGALGETAVAISKPALDLVLLAQTEVGEAIDARPDRGTSSTLPQKRNPTAAIAARAAAAQAPGLVATLLAAAGGGEHERAAGAWHAEWQPLTALLRATGSAAAWLRDALEHLDVNIEQMRENANLTGGGFLAERLVAALAPAIGFEAASEEVRAAAGEARQERRPIADVIGRRPIVAAHLDPATIGSLMDPATYLGGARQFADRALVAHRAIGRPEHADANWPPRPAGSPVRLHRLVDGLATGPVLVLVHSLGTDMSIWDEQVDALRDRFRIVCCDIRGHGRSPATPGRYSIADLGGDLIALLDELSIPSANVCGMSIGGMIAMWVAATAPDRVERLVLCATSARLGPPERWAERIRQVEVNGVDAIVDRVVDGWLTPTYAARHPAIVARLKAKMVATDPAGYVGCCSAIERMDLTEELGRIAAPTLVLAGGSDEAIPPEHGRRLAEGIPDARLEIVPDAAHLLNVERGAVVTRFIEDHLTANVGAGH